VFLAWDESKLFDAYLSNRNSNPRLKLKSSLQSERQNKLKNKSTLACYSSNSTQKGQRSKTDCAFRIYNTKIRTNAFIWRRNLVGFIDLISPEAQLQKPILFLLLSSIEFQKSYQLNIYTLNSLFPKFL
jgi:hypothetical protein